MANQKQFIIKADDYGRGGANLDPWRRFIDCALDEYLTLSIGVVGSEFTQNKAVPLYLRSIVEEYGIEVWNHSNKHPNFITLNQAQIENEILESQKIISNELGTIPTIFGPPFNKIDVASANHVIDLDVFKGFYAFDKLVAPGKNIELKYFSGVEIGTDTFRPMRLDVFESEMVRREWPDFLVLQLHPYYWSINCLDVFKKILRILKDESYICINAEDRINYWTKKVLNDEQFEAGKTLADNILHEESVITVLEQDSQADRPKLREDSSYYIRVLKRGTSEIFQFYKNLGIQNAPKVDGRLKILDVGAGIGNWTAAAALLEDSYVVSIDREDTHLGLMAKNVSEEKIKIEISTLERMNEGNGIFSAIICNNTLSYLNIFDAMETFWRKLEFSGMLFLGLQNRLYPLRDAIQSAKKGNYDSSIQFLRRLIDNEGARAGLIEPPFIQYWNSSELQEVGISCGLKLQRRSLLVPGSFAQLLNHELFGGYFFTKTRAAENIKKQYQDGKILMKLMHRFDQNIWTKTNSLIADIYSAGVANEKASISEVFARYDLDINAMSQERADQIALYINCSMIDMGLQNFEMKMEHQNLFAKIYVLYSAINSHINDGIENALRDLEKYLLKISPQELGYWS